MSHARRPRFFRPTPVHVTLRVKPHVWHLRSGRCFRRIRSAFEQARGRFGVRLIEYSILGNHLHLILEADDSAALSRAMQGLAIRIAKALNSLMNASGAVFGDHYFAHLLKTPTELAHAIRYVLENFRRHFGGTGTDPFSSAALRADERTLLLAEARSWLLLNARRI